MSESLSPVVVASKQDLEEFFSSEVRGEMETAFPKVRWIDPGETAVPFESAEVIVGGWALSNVPLDAVTDGPLRYVCLFTGSPTGKVTRQHVEAGMLLTNWGTAASPFVAEGGLLMILTALRRSHEYSRLLLHEKEWRSLRNPAGTLHGKRVGVHGFGGIARSLIELMRPFGVQMSVHAPGVPRELIEAVGATPVGSLEELAAGAEVFVEIEAARADNRRCVNHDVLSRLPIGATFVNFGRGHLVDESALVAVANERKLRVALDVYDQEPLPDDSPLRSIEGVLLMPHMAGPPPEARRHLGRLAVDNVRRYAAGESPRFLIDADAFDRLT
ncbi:MAG: NAD(P)-dependent oxidoreductase [Planctomycetota bacterium]